MASAAHQNSVETTSVRSVAANDMPAGDANAPAAPTGDTTSDITAQVRQFVVENFLFEEGADDLHADQSFLEAGIIDSTGVLELVSFLEERFAIAFADDELIPDNLDSIGRIVAFVRSKMALGV